MDAPHLTTPELAALLRKSPRTLERWRRQGKGPRCLPGVPVTYPEAEVKAWVEANLTGATAQ